MPAQSRVLKSVLTLVLGGAAVALALGIWWLHTTPADTGPTVTGGQAADWAPQLGAVTSAEFVAKPLSEFGETLKRPLFEPERRPFVPKPPEPKNAKDPEPEPAAPAPEKPRENLTIAGVKIFNGERQALIIVESSKEARWVGKGDSIAGWKIVSISGAGAEVSAGATRRKILLYVDKR